MHTPRECAILSITSRRFAEIHGTVISHWLSTGFSIDYRIHTDAIKEQIIPKEVTKTQAAAVYASEADMVNG